LPGQFNPQPTSKLSSSPPARTPVLSHYDAILIDLDGTFYREEHDGARVLPGAVELIHRLNHARIPYACLTNSGSSPRQLAARLAEMHAPVDESHIWSCVAACAEYILHRFAHPGRKPAVFNTATDGLAELLDGKVDWVSDPDQPCDAVITAAPVNRWATPDRQWTALQLLRRGRQRADPAQRPLLIGTCADRVYPSHRGLEFGAGALTEYFAYAGDTTPIYCGKPEEVFFHELCTRLNVQSNRCLLIGDNLDSDVAGARRVGMASALVLTGVATRQDAAQTDSSRRPDFIIETLLELR
jgi:HAD superfamily hydrolase (TIGR01450 family)